MADPILADATVLTLPVYAAVTEQDDGTVTFLMNGVTYVTEGYIEVEIEHNLVATIRFQPPAYDGLPFTRDYWSDYENSEAEARAAALNYQRQLFDDTGLVFPISIRA